MSPRLLLATLLLAGAAAGASADDAVPRPVVETGAHGRALTALAVGGAGRLLYTAARDGTVRSWDLQQGGAPAGVLRLPEWWGVPAFLSLSPDGGRLAVEVERRQDFELQLGRAAGGPAAPSKVPGDRDDRSDPLGLYHFRSDGRTLGVDRDRAGRTVRAAAQFLCLYDPGLRHLAHTAVPAGLVPASVRFSPDGKKVAVGYAGLARIDVVSGDDLKLLYQPDMTGVREGDLRSVSFSSSGAALYAGGAYAWGDGHPLRRWEDAGRGRYQDLPGARQDITALAALPQGGVAFAAADPAWGVVSERGERVLLQPAPVLDHHGGQLLVDPAGTRLQLTDEWTGARVGFSLADRALVTDPPKDAALQPPRTVDARLPVLDWQAGRRLLLGPGGVPYSLPELVEPGRALHIAADGRSFLLGAGAVLYQADRERIALGREGPVAALTTGAAIRAAAGILSLQSSADGRLLIAALEDGTVRWYGAADRRELLALQVHADRRRWVLFTPGGYYDASPGGEELFGFKVERPEGQLPEFFPAGRFRQRYHRADIIDAALGPPGPPGAGPQLPPPAPPLTQRQLPPIVTLLSQAGATPIAGEARVRVLVRSPSGAPVTGLRVLLDGRAAPRARGVALDDGAPQGGAPGEEVRELLVPLQGREATLAVVADSAAGPSEPAVLRLPERPPRDGGVAPRLYVLAVGVGAYPQGDLRLQYPAKDARDLVAALSAQRGKLYRGVEARVLLDKKATRAAILDGLSWLQRSATDLDVAVMFFAGHGVDDPGTGQYYFLPQDADQAKLMSSALPDVQIREALAALPGKVLLLLDTCHAGKIFSGRSLRGVGSFSRLVAELASAEGGVVVLAAATARQAAQEDRKWKNGAFTKALVEGLSGKADLQRSGRVTLNMLSLYVSERVKALTKGTQTPTVAMPSTVPDFPVAASPR